MFPAHFGDAGTDQGLVADEPEGEADQDRREGGVRKSQDQMKSMLPRGFGSGRSLAFIALIGVALWLATGFYRVQPDEQGIALVLGKVWKLTDPGRHYNLPAPIGEVYTPWARASPGLTAAKALAAAT
jgi:hypothetical protein